MSQLTKDQILTQLEEKRTRCKVYERCMGYHRPVESWNLGKQGEHMERKHFVEKIEVCKK